MPRYLLLLHENPSATADVSPAEMEAVIARYVAWGQELGERGMLVANDKLTEEGGRRVRKDGGRVVVVDGPYSEAKEVVGGFYVVKAADYDEAARIAGTCPHADFGTIEVRQIEEFGG